MTILAGGLIPSSDQRQQTHHQSPHIRRVETAIYTDTGVKAISRPDSGRTLLTDARFAVLHLQPTLV